MKTALLVSCVPLALNFVGIEAFSDRLPSFRIHKTHHSITCLSSAVPQHHDESSSPSAVFGTPLSDKTKDFNKKMVESIKSMVFDVLFSGESLDRAYARFYALETIARTPYFAYLSVLHLYETLGWWRQADYIKLHFAESWNEAHHLRLMEELGGNRRWVDRLVAEHVAFFYFWTVVAAYMVNPTFAYNLNQVVEEHAFLTYSNFATEHKNWLETQPAPKFILEYYRGAMFDEMHFSSEPARRRDCKNLYDVFCNVRDDEKEHVKTMVILQQDGTNVEQAVENSDGQESSTAQCQG